MPFSKALLSVCLFFALTSIATAQNILDAPISATYENKSAIEILTDLETKAPVKFFYRSEWLSPKPNTFSFNNKPLGTVLEALFAKATGASADTLPKLSFVAYDQNSIIIAKDKDLKESYGKDYWINRSALQEAITAQGQALGNSAEPSKIGKAIIKGVILDAQNNSPIPGAIVRSEISNVNTASDADGKYELQLPLGLHKIEIDAAGFESQITPVRVFNDASFDVQLFKGNIKLNEITIRDAATKKIRSTTVGLSELSIKEIKQLPSFMGEADVIKSLMSLPGVSSVGEASAGYNVRGGNIDQNLILQDGQILLNSSHALGFFSTFNADVVKKVALYKGEIPAQFGGRTSSVLDVQLLDGNKERWQVNGGIGPFSGRLTIDGPIVKDKTTLLIAGRSTFSDWILRSVNDVNIKNSQMSFYDWNAKLTHKISENATLSLSAYDSYDHFQYSKAYGFNWRTQSFGVDYRQLITQGVSSTFSASYGASKNETYSPDSIFPYKLNNGLEHYKIKENLLISKIRHNTINAGAEWTLYNSFPEQFSQTASPAQSSSSSQVAKDKGDELSVYINDEIEITKKLSIAAGLRQTVYRQLGPATVNTYAPNSPLDTSSITGSTSYTNGQTIQSYNGLEPRIALNYIVEEGTSIKLSYNRLFQYIHLISNTAASTPVDVWQVSTKYIPPQKSDNFSLGYFKNINGNDWETSVEVYYKLLDNLLEYKDFASLLRNSHIETELLSGIGRSYGAEFYVKKNKGLLTGSLSYSYARTLRKTQGPYPEETINSGNWYPANFDKPNTVNLSFNWQFRKTQSFAVFFTYSTGRPITAASSDYLIGTDGLFPNFSNRNNFRVADYHRLDVSYTIARGEVRTKRYKSSLTFSIYNVYGRQNPFSVFFKQFRDQPLKTYQLAILGTPFPSVTYNFHF